MASFDGAYESLIQGVSEQVPSSRQPGQVSEQVNMVSDLVTGVRRRVGSSLRLVFKSKQADNKMLAWKTDIGGISCEVYVNPVTGELILFEEGGTTEVARFKSDYLRTDRPNTIQYAGVGDSLFIANTLRVPTATKDTSASTFKTTGYFQVNGSALRQAFSVSVTAGGKTYTGAYTTPDGTKPEHVSQVTTEYVAQQVFNNLRAQSGFTGAVDSYRDGSTVFFKSKVGDMSVTTPSGKIYITTSRGGVIETVGDLVKSLPAQGDGSVIGVGKFGGDLTYFKYIHKEVRWEETAKPGGTINIKNMPVELSWGGDAWELNEKEYPGRVTGDEETNPDPEFIGWGITGITSYQGRLVLLSGSWVHLSASNKPRQFYRSTVTDLLDSDPIEIGSSSASSASFKYGVVFNKDLILFSSAHQALIPGLNQAITPSNAHILVTSTYTADMTCAPATLGSSLMYPMPRSSRHFGMMEMIPSSYTDSMYESLDASEHIPTYMKGRCRFAVSSSVGSMVVMGTTNSPRDLYVHEYMWSDTEKVLKAWHKWEFGYDIAHAFFSGGLINLVSVDPGSGTVLVSSLDPKSGEGATETSATYFLDNNITLPVQRKGGEVYVELTEMYRDFVLGQGLQEDLRVAYRGGSLNTMQIGAELCPECRLVYLNPSTTAQEVVVGAQFESWMVPSPPVFKDYLERVISYNRVQLIKMYAVTNTSGEFKVSIKDGARRGTIEYGTSPVQWYSTQLNLGRLPVGGRTGTVIPCRVDAKTAEVEFRSSGLSEMNIINLEYTCRSGRMRPRR